MKLFQVLFIVNPIRHECSISGPCCFSSAHISVSSLVSRLHWLPNIKVWAQTLSQKAMWCYLPRLGASQDAGSRVKHSSNNRGSLQTSLEPSARHCARLSAALCGHVSALSAVHVRTSICYFLPSHSLFCVRKLHVGVCHSKRNVCVKAYGSGRLHQSWEFYLLLLTSVCLNKGFDLNSF